MSCHFAIRSGLSLPKPVILPPPLLLLAVAVFVVVLRSSVSGHRLRLRTRLNSISRLRSTDCGMRDLPVAVVVDANRSAAPLLLPSTTADVEQGDVKDCVVSLRFSTSEN